MMLHIERGRGPRAYCGRPATIALASAARVEPAVLERLCRSCRRAAYWAVLEESYGNRELTVAVHPWDGVRYGCRRKVRP